MTGRYGAHYVSAGPGMCVTDQPKTFTDLIDACLKPHVFNGNVLVGAPNVADPKKWPAGNQFVANVSAVGFKDAYALADDSPFKGAGTDGRDPGPDIPRLLAAIDGVEAGVSPTA